MGEKRATAETEREVVVFTYHNFSVVFRMMTKRSIFFLWLVLMLYAAVQASLVANSGSVPFVGVFLYNLIAENFRLLSIWAMLCFAGRYVQQWHIGKQILVYAAWVLATSLMLIGANLSIVFVGGRDSAFLNIWNNKHWILLQNVLENGLIIAGFVVARYRREIGEQKERERELRLLNTQMELAALRAQLNPHFLFNALNVVNALVGVQPDEARRVLEMLSDLLRYTLESDKREMVRLQEELDFVQKYLALEQARFGKRLQYRIEADETLLDALIPPMLLQPLVENAVKHGISPKASGGKVSVSIAPEQGGKRLVVEICDNGIGLQHSMNTHSTGIGLVNIASRLEKLFGGSAAFTMRNNGTDTGGGVTVSLVLPIA